MPKKNTTASEPIVSGGAAPARMRKHAPAKRAKAAVEPSSSIDTTAITYSEEVVTSTKSVVSSDEIAKLAYSYWESRGYQGGSPEDDWMRAEQELTARLAKTV